MSTVASGNPAAARHAEASLAKEPSIRRPFVGSTWGLLACVLIFAAIYGGIYLNRGWVPHDDGSFALSAQRFLNGELPHRDYDEIYTGGLTVLNAAALRVFGPNLMSLRYPLFAAFLLWVVSVFVIARRFVSDLAALCATLLVIAVSYPNYTAAVPSWYNLFLATFGILAFFRFSEDGRLFWVFLAGICGGVSFLMKAPGLYFVAAGLCFLLYREQNEDISPTRQSRPLLRYAIALMGMVFVLQVWKTISWVIDPRFVIHFLIPSALVIAVLIKREFSHDFRPDHQRIARLLVLDSVFLVGVVLPVVLFLVPYIRSGSVHDFVRGVFELPFKRAQYAVRVPPPLYWVGLCSTGILVVLLVFGTRSKKNGASDSPLRRSLPALIALGIAVLSSHLLVYWILWFALVLLIPVTVAIALWRLDRLRMPATLGERIFLLTAAIAICSLIQFPFSAPIYLLYILPLVPLVWLALASASLNWSRGILAAVCLCYFAFFVLRVTPTFIVYMGGGYLPMQTETLALPRAGGLRVEPKDRAIYEPLIELVQQHRQGQYIYAAPDCPEIYFLSGSREPNRTMFDFFDDPENRVARILSEIERSRVNVVVINDHPAFSRAMDDQLRTQLVRRYPNRQTVGHFEVRWAE